MESIKDIIDEFRQNLAGLWMGGGVVGELLRFRGRTVTTKPEMSLTGKWVPVGVGRADWVLDQG